MAAMAMPMPSVAVMMVVMDDDPRLLDQILLRGGGEPAHRHRRGDCEAGREYCSSGHGGGRAPQQGFQHCAPVKCRHFDPPARNYRMSK
jgi:hypothetical protein